MADIPSYETMINAIYTKIEKPVNKQLNLPGPILLRSGKEYVFTNMEEIAKRLNRSSDHLLNFIKSDMEIPVSISNGHIYLKNLPRNFKIDPLILKYASIYVICKECKSCDTKLEKNKLTCNRCESFQLV
jgi:translation initiation factor 2 beta subunit (eIF-2beta)/eIF-5